MSVREASGTISEVSYIIGYFEWKIPFDRIPQQNSTNTENSPTFWHSDGSWYLEVHMNVDNSDNCAFTLCLFMVDPVPVAMEASVTFGIKIADWTEKMSPKQVTLGKMFVPHQYTVVKNDIYKNWAVSRPEVTFNCCLNVGLPKIAKKKPTPDMGGLEILSSNFKDLLMSKKECDVKIKVQNSEFQAHRAVLMARSSVFAGMFKHGMSEKKTGIVTIPDCDPKSFGDFLMYLYTGKTNDISLENIHNLYITADKYDVQGLKSFCHDYMIQNLTSKNISGIAVVADLYDDVELLSSVQDFFNRNFRKILSMAEWESLMKNDYRIANKLLRGMVSTTESPKVTRKRCSKAISPSDQKKSKGI